MLRLWLNDDEDEHLVAHILSTCLLPTVHNLCVLIWQMECEGEEEEEERERERDSRLSFLT